MAFFGKRAKASVEILSGWYGLSLTALASGKTIIRGYLLSNPAKYVKEPKKPEPDFRFLTEDEIKVFLQTVVEKDPEGICINEKAIRRVMKQFELFPIIWKMILAETKSTPNIKE